MYNVEETIIVNHLRERMKINWFFSPRNFVACFARNVYEGKTISNLLYMLISAQYICVNGGGEVEYKRLHRK